MPESPPGGVNRELAEITGLSKFEFKDVKGKKHSLVPLDLKDLVDLETKFGSLAKLGKTEKVEDILHILWLSLRKEGLNDEQIDREKWIVTVSNVGRMFQLGDIASLMDVVEKLYILSGFKEDVIKKAMGVARSALPDALQQPPDPSPASAPVNVGDAPKP